MKHHIVAAKLCHLSYGKEKHITFKWTANLSNHEEDVQAYSFDSQGFRYITIRGSSSPKDWCRNLQTKLLITPYQNQGYDGEVLLHSGFYTGYKSIQDQVLNLAETDLKLILCGHSQGGAIASIAAVDIEYTLSKKVELITLGSPPVGNEAWAYSAQKRIKSSAYINRFDIVPSLLGQYYHGTNQINLTPINFNNPHHTKNYYQNVKRFIISQKPTWDFER